MKCSYRFRVSAKLTLSQAKPIRVRGLLYEFESADGILRHIKVTRELANHEWPQFGPSTQPGISYDLKLNDGMVGFIQLEMCSLEAALSLFGVDSIDVDYPEITWIPENDAEKQALHVTHYSITADNDFPPCPLSFDVMVRTVIAAVDLLQVELPLSFFRHGRIAYGERKYIEAIYQFYFLFETLFGNGKTRNEAIKKEFKKSGPLRSATEAFLQTPNPFLPDETAQQVSEKIKNFDSERLIEYMVDLRGFLHHHTSKRKKMWHPSRQGEYSIDALIFAEVALKIFVDVLFKHINTPEVLKCYGEMLQGQT